MALERLQINIDGDLLRDVDAYAEGLHINRTAAVSVLLSRALQSDKLMDSFVTMVDAYKDEQAAQVAKEKLEEGSK